MKPQHNTICTSCGYSWNTNSKLKAVTCPNDQKKTVNVAALTRDQKLEHYVNLKRSHDNGNQNLHTSELSTLTNEQLEFKLIEQLRLSYMKTNKVSIMAF